MLQLAQFIVFTLNLALAPSPAACDPEPCEPPVMLVCTDPPCTAPVQAEPLLLACDNPPCDPTLRCDTPPCDPSVQQNVSWKCESPSCPNA